VTPAAGRLRDRLVEEGKRKLMLPALQAIFGELEPAMGVSPRRRAALLELLEELEAAKEVQLTKLNPDHFALPALPRSVLVLGVEPRSVKPPPPTPVWRPELAWASGLRLALSDVEFLSQVDRFLRDVDPTEPIVPIRERSLELTGDEKRLDRLVGTRLFDPGRLSLALLRCQQVHPPFVYARVHASPAALVIENHQTYHSMLKTPTAIPDVGLLVYGAGNHITGSITYFADIEPRVRAIKYFGDIDLEGLQIPRRAHYVAQSLGLPPVDPAPDLYRLLLCVGRMAKADPVSSAIATRAANWLPEDLRGEVVEILVSGRRMAQEAVGHKVLVEMGVRMAAGDIKR
jgi:hypothetical protein